MYYFLNIIVVFKMSSQVAKAARRVTHELHGIVVSAGRMQKTVKVRVGGQKWNKNVNKVGPLSGPTRKSLLIQSTMTDVLTNNLCNDSSGLPILNTTSSTTRIPPSDKATPFPLFLAGQRLNKSVTLSSRSLLRMAHQLKIELWFHPWRTDY